ncbi:type I restriction-modification system subunit M [Adlercreutzia sp. ZJ473]|uniref:type I restriction-modification system subunit M n=1 Tax=Adlercreutzia sp. ZJ473 TaxID=2722822 RepID=UPI001557165D|nr:type I restriction-modification system subunit M [Adlercreutzia sp. ZJ473]
MPEPTKEQQRAELHKTIWSIADDLRGSVDGWDFKQYILGMLFYRFISENLCDYLASEEARSGNVGFDYASLSDEEAEYGRGETVKERGFYILPSELFQNVRARARHDENLNETLERVFKNIEGSAVGSESEGDLKGLFDDMDVNSAKLGNTVAERNKKLATLLEKIGSLDFGGSFKENRIDAFGDAYEYLMTMYASNAGKSGGEFFTPQEVSELLARITLVGRTEVGKVYDPCCGSGSLLLRFAKILGADKVRKGFFGQEINLTTYNLARINMFLHDINFDKFDIALGDTLKNPQHWDDEPFDCIVSNPPYSIKWEGKKNPLNINDPRFSPAGVLAPDSKADLAFTMHMLSWLSTDGTAAIVEFPGVLYRGGAEAKIRAYLVRNNFVDAVIQLPPDLFFGTTIATCVIVLKKSKSANDVLFVDASAEFERRDSKNKLMPGNIQHIMDVIERRSEEEHFSKRVSNDDVIANDANLSVSSYVEKEDMREEVDIKALNAEIARIVAREQELRERIDAIVADLEGEAS